MTIPMPITMYADKSQVSSVKCQSSSVIYQVSMFKCPCQASSVIVKSQVTDTVNVAAVFGATVSVSVIFAVPQETPWSAGS